MPLAPYGVRGSEQAVRNIKGALTPRSRAVLLANHGILCFHTTAAMAVQMNVIVEEAAQAAILAGSIGGPVAVPPELLHASHDRAARCPAQDPGMSFNYLRRPSVRSLPVQRGKKPASSARRRPLPMPPCPLPNGPLPTRSG